MYYAFYGTLWYWYRVQYNDYSCIIHKRLRSCKHRAKASSLYEKMKYISYKRGVPRTSFPQWFRLNNRSGKVFNRIASPYTCSRIDQVLKFNKNQVLTRMHFSFLRRKSQECRVFRHDYIRNFCTLYIFSSINRGRERYKYRCIEWEGLPRRSGG